MEEAIAKKLGDIGEELAKLAGRDRIKAIGFSELITAMLVRIELEESLQ